MMMMRMILCRFNTNLSPCPRPRLCITYYAAFHGRTRFCTKALGAKTAAAAAAITKTSSGKEAKTGLRVSSVARFHVGNSMYSSSCLFSATCHGCSGALTPKSGGGNSNKAAAVAPFHKTGLLPAAVWIKAAPDVLCSSKNMRLRPRLRARPFCSNGQVLDDFGGNAAERDEEEAEREDKDAEAGKGVEDANAAVVASQQGKSRMQRRRGNAVLGSVDLLSVPGIGLRNMQKLVEKGIGKVSDLKQLYRDRFLRGGSDKMVEYLRNSVGIVHKNHAESITSYIRDSVDKEMEDETLPDDQVKFQKKRLTFCVEGNISVGKTTFLQRIANETVELRDLVEVVPEPISKWQDVGPEHFNILNAFYAEPHRYAYTFQNYVFVTRVMQERESSSGIKPLRLMERSVFSDRMVFVRAVHEAKWMNEMELSIYDSWFDPVVSALPGLVPDGFIYLRASPDTCHRRLQLRKRAEEDTVSLEYLQGLHEKHENWLLPAQCAGNGVLSVSHLPSDMGRFLHAKIKDRLILLQGDHVHASIQKVPALILDYEPNIDFSRDIEAKREYAQQIADFFEFVKKMKEGETPEHDEAKFKNVVLPRTGGLIGPDGNLLCSSLNASDFWRSVSPS